MKETIYQQHENMKFHYVRYLFTFVNYSLQKDDNKKHRELHRKPK